MLLRMALLCSFLSFIPARAGPCCCRRAVVAAKLSRLQLRRGLLTAALAEPARARASCSAAGGDLPGSWVDVVPA